MAIPTIIAVNQTAGDIFLTRLGLTVPLLSTLQLDLFAYVDEIRQDESLYNAIVAGNIKLDFGSGPLTTGDSIKFFNIVTQEVRISVTAVEASANRALTGGATIDDIVMATGDRALLTAQTNPVENGVWVVNTGGAWSRPEDYDTAQSAAGALFYIQEGTNYAGNVWGCTTLTGSDVIGSNSLGFAQVSGGGAGADTLQSAYNNGNTIVTAASTDIAFTLTSGDFTVDGAGSVVFGGTTPLGDFSVDTGTMSLDSTDTTNVSMTANDAGNKTLTIAASNSGAGTGIIDMTADGTINIDGAGGVSINSSAGALGLGDDADTGNINIGTGASARVITVGNNTGATALDFNSGTGGITMDSESTMSLDSKDTTNLTMSANDGADKTLTIAASNAGAGNGNIAVSADGTVDMQAGGNVTIDSSGGTLGIGTDDDDFAINVGTNGERQITIGNNTGTTGVAIETGSGNLLIDAPVTTMTGNLVVQGTTTTVESEIVNIKDQFLYLNDGYETTGSPRDGGIVVNVNPQAANTVVDTGGFTAAVLATSNATVRVTDASVFSVGDYIQIKGANDQTNDGLYEVLAIDTGAAPDILKIAGIGGDGAPVYDFVQNDFTTDTTVAGTVRKVEVGVIRINTSGGLDYAYGGDSTMTFEDVILTSTLTLQGAYDGGQTITTDASGNVLIAGTQALQVTATGGLDVDTVADFDVTTFDVQMTGNNGFSIDGTADSNVTATNTVATTNVTLELTADNQGATSGDATVDINATSTNGSGIVDVNADDQVAIDVAAGGTIDIGTDAVAQEVTVGNTTGASGVTINSGTEKVEIDGVTYYGSSAGAPTATSSGFQDGDKYYDTNLDMEMRYDSTRAKFLSVEAMFLQWGRNGNTAADQFYRGIDGRIMGYDGAHEIGYYMPHDGTVVGLGYTRSDDDNATFEVTEDSVATGAEVASNGVFLGGSNALNADVTAGGVLGVRNKTGSSTTSDVMGWVKVRWRVTP